LGRKDMIISGMNLLRIFSLLPTRILNVNKAISVTNLGRCEMIRIQQCLDNRLTDGSKVCQPYAPAALYSPEALFFYFWLSFLLEAEQTLGLSAAGRFS
jgi:hypothetical protein